MEIALFPQTQPRCSICQFAHPPCPSPHSGAGAGERSPRLSGNVLPTPSWAEGESDIFLGLSGQPAWPPCRAAFRDAGLGRSEGTFGPRLRPFPPGSQARVSALGHFLPAHESQHPGQAISSGKSREAARDRGVTLRGPSSHPPRPRRSKGRGRSRRAERGAGPGAAGHRGAAPGVGREQRTGPGPARARRREPPPPPRPPRAQPVPAQGAGASQLTPPAAPPPRAPASVPTERRPRRSVQQPPSRSEGTRVSMGAPSGARQVGPMLGCGARVLLSPLPRLPRA